MVLNAPPVPKLRLGVIAITCCKPGCLGNNAEFLLSGRLQEALMYHKIQTPAMCMLYTSLSVMYNETCDQ